MVNTDRHFIDARMETGEVIRYELLVAYGDKLIYAHDLKSSASHGLAYRKLLRNRGTMRIVLTLILVLTAGLAQAATITVPAGTVLVTPDGNRYDIPDGSMLVTPDPMPVPADSADLRSLASLCAEPYAGPTDHAKLRPLAGLRTRIELHREPQPEPGQPALDFLSVVVSPSVLHPASASRDSHAPAVLPNPAPTNAASPHAATPCSWPARRPTWRRHTLRQPLSLKGTL